MNLQKTIPIVCLIVFALVLSACAPTGESAGQPQATPNMMTPAVGQTPQAESPTSSPASGESLEGTHWALVSLGKPGEETPVIEGSNVTLEFEDDGQVGGSGGCNSYSGQYQVDGNTIAFPEVVSTLMACADEQITAQETRYLQALGTTGRYTIADDRLSIMYDNDQNVLNFVQMAAPSTTSTQLPVIKDANLMPNGADKKQYTLTAETGQTITIKITSDGAPLSLTITTPSGVQRFPEVTQGDGGFQINHTFSANETGDYRMMLAKADQTPGTNYTATFMVQ